MNIRKIKKLLKPVRITKTYDGFDLKLPTFWISIYFDFSDYSLKTCSIDFLKFIIMYKDYQSAYIILTHRKSRNSLKEMLYNNILLLQLLEDVITLNRDFLMSYINFCKKMNYDFYSEKLKRLELFL